jgi:hypothetical protein
MRGGRFFVGFVVLVWMAAAAAGTATLWRYAMAPGAAGSAPERWPEASRLPRPADQAVLVMLAHPHCPCSRASVHELSRLMTRAQGKLTAHVLLVLPQGVGESWAQSDLRASAEAIPGVSVRLDPAGAEAQRFGALTSGQAVLYDRDGVLRFSGGITAGRGHQGDNAGRSAILAALEDPGLARAGAPVFGCALTAKATAKDTQGVTADDTSDSTEPDS